MRVYNTLTRKKEEFIPLNGKRVGMYVCGPTVYDYSHVGHARSYVAFDVIRRYLEYKGYTVIYIQNITDVDDKIIKRANELGEDPLSLSKRFTEAYFEDMEKLNVQRANIHPKVSDHIPEIIEFIDRLIKEGYAYEVDGNVYFSVSKAKDYGKLSHQPMENILAGARVEVDKNKRDPRDFALWKKVKPGEIFWESPWGKGRPGWHIECSAMAIKYLGPSIDIHGGGMDLIFPHHECEIAQSEAYTGKPFVKYWIHNGFVTINKEKMSKSLGNFFTIREVLEKYDGETLRFFLLSTHYRSQIDYSDKHLQEAKQALQRIRGAINKLKTLIKQSREESKEPSKEERELIEQVRKSKQKFMDAMDDDFNTREAMPAIFELTRMVNSLDASSRISRSTLEEALQTYNEFGQILGLFQEEERRETYEETVGKLVDILIELRNRFRKEKDWETADYIRERMREAGILLEDSREGTTWKIIEK
ncbi:MAG: cysteine--tRNA ligase [Candidatus Freyrarchaeum guaymaensis]|nr:cysteine--tRNA ligase [Candidatus Sigynarchaeota archaeon]